MKKIIILLFFSLSLISCSTLQERKMRENIVKNIKLKNYNEALKIAKKKAEAYTDVMSDGQTLLLTSDTVVILDGVILGKPSSADEARKMLKSLSGRVHDVVSGVALTTVDWQRSFSDLTKVRMRSFSDDIIDYYVENYKPFDKAGAYGIQEWIGLVGINSIEGSYHNVMGLPTQRLFDELRTIR